MSTSLPYAPSRRTLMLGVGAAAAAGVARAGAPASGQLTFHAMRGGKKIGEHHLTFSRSGDLLTVRTEVNLAIGLGPITLFRYAYHASERWRGEQFVSIESRTDASDNHARITAERTERGVAIEGAKGGKLLLPAETVPLVHWNLAAMRTPIFNPQEGKRMQVGLSRGEAQFDAGRQGRIRATRVTMTGEAKLEDYYDASGTWIGLDAKAKDGSIISYKKV